MGRWEKPTNNMPAFRLADLDGKVWNLSKLKGKIVLVGIWATWSAPCHVLMPKFQKIYEQLQDRADVEVLTFNVDEDASLVKPYMQKHGLSFPVLPSHVFVGQLVGFLSVPRVWIIDADGVWKWEQVGFDMNDANWETELFKRLDLAEAAGA